MELLTGKNSTLKQPFLNGWLNVYKPKGISSAKLVSIIKRLLPKTTKVGHCGTLDLEASGVLPLAIGEATKLVQFLMDATKEYVFTVQFGAKTDTADSAGTIVETTNHIPTFEECKSACSHFLGDIIQIPPKFSALKVNGQRSYELARKGIDVKLKARKIHIYNLKCLEFFRRPPSATYIVECSKGTYVRTLAEDLALYLQSLGFVIELRRTRAGIFGEQKSIRIENFAQTNQEESFDLLEKNLVKIEAVLDDILVFEADQMQAQKIRFGQKCYFDSTVPDIGLLWIRHDNKIIAIGALANNCFISSRVFNL
jgi:tRNA pseudouridine55 synthase